MKKTIVIIGLCLSAVVVYGLLLDKDSCDGFESYCIGEALQQKLTNIRSQMELYRNQNQYSYKGGCDSESVTIYLESASEDLKLMQDSYGGDDSNVTCVDSSDEWRASVFQYNEGNYYCVDESNNGVELVDEPESLSCK
ncbi:MAG: hypothetical protein KC877_01570 [Candidatus Kaiserbacteria bacterium]|nr:hypothetical protein [Candidatus Kaiserbacteria bacterium]MCB9816225.1 hypothetical protein [Candidatus Nomurabacteria bacterium]